MPSRPVFFNLYRYQILPTDRGFQGDIFEKRLPSVAELLEKKNDIFDAALDSIDQFEFKRANTNTKKIYAEDQFYLYLIAANRSLRREKQDFTQEQLDNWPAILVAVWNRPNKQYIAVQRKTTAFQNNYTVSKAIAAQVDALVSDAGLTVICEPLFDKHAFWELIKAHSGNVVKVVFDLVTPNMANISGSMSSELKDLAKSTNSVRNKLSLESDTDSALIVSEDNTTLNGLVEYAGEGGGNIKLRVKGMRKSITTSRSTKEVEIENLNIDGEHGQNS